MCAFSYFVKLFELDLGIQFMNQKYCIFEEGVSKSEGAKELPVFHFLF